MFYFNRLTKFFIVFAVITYSTASSADDTRAISDFIYKIGDETITIITNDKLSKGKKEMELTTLFLNTVDVDLIGQQSIGKYWKIINADLQKEFLELYRQHLAAAYVSRFEEYTNERIKVLKVIPERDKKFVYFVQTKLERENAEPINVGYFVKKQPDNKSFKIVDIEAEGISMITTQRSELGSVISRHGIPELFKRLRRKVKFLTKQRPFIIKAVQEF